MPPFWAVFLLCSLLTPSQGLGITPLLAKVDADDPTKSLDLQQLPAGAGGTLPSRLLRKRSLLGLGFPGQNLIKDDLTGSLRDKDGVRGLPGNGGGLSGLRGDGFVGSLRGRRGLIGDLLGNKSPLDGLLGGDGLVGSLLSGDGLTGDLLGNKSPLNVLLGGDRLTGDLLGGGGLGDLLGGGGLVGSLLSGDGLTGDLLGNKSPLDGLLGGDRLTGDLLGGGGLGDLLGGGGLGDLLGGGGLVGSLLSGDGLTGDLLGNKSPLDGLLGEGGLLDGLVSKDGAIGGLVGKDGVLDALLGTKGLLVEVLRTVMDLLRKNGIFRKNGLAGNLLGGDGEDSTGTKIVNNTLPKITLRSIPGLGHQVGFNTQLLVESSSVPGKVLCVQVEADVAMLVKDKWEDPQNNECKALNINVRLRPKVPLLEEPLIRLLRGALSEAGCNIVNTGLNALRSQLGSGILTLPPDALPPFSIVSDNAIKMDINQLPVQNLKGGVAASTQGLPLTASLLLAPGRAPQLSLSQRALGALLETAQRQGALDLSITSSMVPDSISLSTAALLPFIPQLSKILPGSLPLELRVRVPNKPLVTVSGEEAAVTLKASIDVVSPALQSTQQPLFSLDTDIDLGVTPSVLDGKLQTTLGLNSVKVTRAPPILNPLSMSRFAEWVKQVLGAAYIPDINDILSVALPLPNTLNGSLRNAQVNITDGDDSPDETNLKGLCSEGSLITAAI